MPKIQRRRARSSRSSTETAMPTRKARPSSIIVIEKTSRTQAATSPRRSLRSSARIAARPKARAMTVCMSKAQISGSQA